MPTTPFACKCYTFEIPAAKLFANRYIIWAACNEFACKHHGFELPARKLLVDTVCWDALDIACKFKAFGCSGIDFLNILGTCFMPT